MAALYRIGLIVPSSNVTMETEVPEMLRRHSESEAETFTIHSSRVRMNRVTTEELTAMVQDSDRCAVELSDAGVDAIAYACLVAIMTQGAGYHETAERRLAEVAARNGCPAPVISSAGALLRAIQAGGFERIAIVAPYMRPLTELVATYIQSAGIEVVDTISLQIPKNLDVARHDPMLLPEIAGRLDLRRAQAVVLSACVQMPSLAVLSRAEEELGLPVVSAAAATTFELLGSLGLRQLARDSGALLSGAYTAAPAQR